MKGMKKSHGETNFIVKEGKTHKMPPDAKYGMPKPHGKACSDASNAQKIMKGGNMFKGE